MPILMITIIISIGKYNKMTYAILEAQGFDVEIGGELYSDSLGIAGTDAETYIGTMRSNVETIVNALK
jgi:ABC-type Zn uptake system ZnuABC Zn-binding protein ZnuA